MRKNNLQNCMTCAVEEKRNLAHLSTLGAGGYAEFFVEPSELHDVCELFRLRALLGFPVYILGGGTNVVFADGEIKGVVLSTRRLSGSWWNLREMDAILEAEAGYLLSLVVTESTQEGLTGAEFSFGIPGTVGGAVAGNAGAGGQSMGALLEEVTTVEPGGSLKKWQRGEFEYSYRHFSLTAPDRLIAKCRMKFRRESRAEIERVLEGFRRARSIQPHGARSAGCAFKNPPQDSAGRLLDVCGCKGMRVGDAVVSQAHANFILNAGNAAGGDILKLMETCRDIVFQKTGVRLEPEIKLMGFSG